MWNKRFLNYNQKYKVDTLEVFKMTRRKYMISKCGNITVLTIERISILET